MRIARRSSFDTQSQRPWMSIVSAARLVGAPASQGQAAVAAGDIVQPCQPRTGEASVGSKLAANRLEEVRVCLIESGIRLVRVQELVQRSPVELRCSGA